MTNVIKKECPVCKHDECDIQAAIMLNEGGELVSYNLYRCLSPKQKHTFTVKRKGVLKEQKQVQKYIDASKIILK